MNRLIVGDIHGCYAELEELLDRAGLSAEDEIIALGDLVDRGPYSPQVLDFFRNRPNARSLLGNHERKHVRAFNGELRRALPQNHTMFQFGEGRYPDAVAFMASLPRYIDLPEAILVHGYFEPDVALAEQRDTVLAGTMSGEAYLKKNYDRPWHEIYDGPKPIVVGHQDYRGTGEPFIYRDRVFGIDTGCCHGRRLTGLLLPEFRIISAPSHRDYYRETLDMYIDRRLESDRDGELSWFQIEAMLKLENRPDISPGLIERISNLRVGRARGEKTLADFYYYVLQENGRVLAELRGECAYDELSPREQGSLYARRVGADPLTEFLHLARKGKLTLEELRRRFKTPADVMAYAKRIGLLEGTES